MTPRTPTCLCWSTAALESAGPEWSFSPRSSSLVWSTTRSALLKRIKVLHPSLRTPEGFFLSLSDAGHPQRPVQTARAEDDDGPDVCAVQFHLQGSHPVLAQLQVDMSRREILGRRVMEHEETRNLPLISIIYRYSFYFLHCFCYVKPCTLNRTPKYTETTNAAFKKENLYFLTFGFFSVDEAHFENISLNVAVSVLLSAYMKELDTIAFVTQESRCFSFFPDSIMWLLVVRIV